MLTKDNVHDDEMCCGAGNVRRALGSEDCRVMETYKCRALF